MLLSAQGEGRRFRVFDAKIRNSGEVRIGTSCSSHDGAGRVWWAAGATSTEILARYLWSSKVRKFRYEVLVYVQSVSDSSLLPRP